MSRLSISKYRSCSIGPPIPRQDTEPLTCTGQWISLAPVNVPAKFLLFRVDCMPCFSSFLPHLS